MQQKNQPSFIKRRDVLIIVALLVLAFALALWIWLGREQGACATVVIINNGETAQQISLAANGVYHIGGAKLPVELEVENGRIRFINSVCPDHDCEGFGWLGHDGEWAACLPAGVTVTVTE